MLGVATFGDCEGTRLQMTGISGAIGPGAGLRDGPWPRTCPTLVRRLQLLRCTSDADTARRQSQEVRIHSSVFTHLGGFAVGVKTPLAHRRVPREGGLTHSR